MPRIPIVMPQLGESIAEATIVAFNVTVGGAVEGDQEVLEVETQKAVMGVTSPCSGTIQEWTAEAQRSYAVGEILGYVECSEEEANRLGLVGDAPAPEFAAAAPTEALPHGYSPGEISSSPFSATPPQSKSSSNVAPTLRGLPVPAHASGASFLSPRMKARSTS